MHKVFISHQQHDSAVAAAIAVILQQRHNIATYLDVVDAGVSRAGEELGDYLRGRLCECSSLLAVLSEHTRHSWWVPWEIGVATEKDLPLATYLSGKCDTPDYLRQWPFMSTSDDLNHYANALKTAERVLTEQGRVKTASVARSAATRGYYTSIRAALGQRR